MFDQDGVAIEMKLDPISGAYTMDGEPECAHCGAVPDGTIDIDTDEFKRSHRICNTCVRKILTWL
jgi:hypothetical protein